MGISAGVLVGTVMRSAAAAVPSDTVVMSAASADFLNRLMAVLPDWTPWTKGTRRQCAGSASGTKATRARRVYNNALPIGPRPTGNIGGELKHADQYGFFAVLVREDGLERGDL